MSNPLPDAIIYIDPDQPMNLQNQIRQQLVDGILNGSFTPGMKLPSSRKLAAWTEHDDGYGILIAIRRARSGGESLTCRQWAGIHPG